MRIAIKVGSNILTDSKDTLNTKRMNSLAKGIAEVQDMGHQVVIVSSGAVAAGMKRLGLKKRPRDIKLKQAAAAVGQSALMWTYERSFKKHRKKVAQVLLTRDDLADRKMYINAKNTLSTLLSYGVIPIINENDTVAVDEIRFGDNDQLAALVASLVEADRLIILSDVDGLYEEDPKKKPSAALITHVESITPQMVKLAGKSSTAVGTGGMYSKLLAAQKALRSGVTVNIINGKRPSLLVALIKGSSHGTEFKPDKTRLSARKGWIAFGSRTKGKITVDEGASNALSVRLKSLLPSGITSVEGKFEKGDAILCINMNGNRVAKGLSNYSSDEVKKIIGKKTSEIEEALGYRYSDEVIHRDNIVLL
jgi:glutamate 5-kinase